MAPDHPLPEQPYRLDSPPRKVGGRGEPIDEERLHHALADAPSLMLPRPPRTRLIVIRELVLPNGRPDIVIAAVDYQRLIKRTDAGIPAITAASLAYVIAETRRSGGRTAIKALIGRQKSLTAKDRVMRAISRLSSLDVGAIRSGVLTLQPVLTRPVVVELHAVEAKLNGWSKATRQAHAWDRFVNSSWLAFPESYLSHVPRRAPALRSFGLVGVDRDNAVNIVRRARFRAVAPLNAVLAEEAILARWLTG